MGKGHLNQPLTAPAQESQEGSYPFGDRAVIELNMLLQGPLNHAPINNTN